MSALKRNLFFQELFHLTKSPWELTNFEDDCFLEA